MAKPKQKMAIRLNGGKVRMDLLSPIAERATAEVLTKSLVKYDAHNWRKGMPWTYCIASLRRHLANFAQGIDIDEDSGLPEIDCLACNVMFLQEYYRTHKKFDDRYKLKQAKGKK